MPASTVNPVEPKIIKIYGKSRNSTLGRFAQSILIDFNSCVFDPMQNISYNKVIRKGIAMFLYMTDRHMDSVWAFSSTYLCLKGGSYTV